MKAQKFRVIVIVIGAGIGGLCLAQGLKRAGVNVAVYERDQTPTARLQGFRVHISPEGSQALHACLPPHLWDIFAQTGGEFSQGFTLLTEQLRELLALRGEDDGIPADPIARHRSVSRITLRRILLDGLEDAVHFDKRFVRYEESVDGGITAHFEDGSSATGDVLVAADGVNSQVRQQYLPNAGPVDTGVVAIGGKVWLTDGAMALLPDALLDGPAIVMAPEPCSLFLGVWKRTAGAERYLQELGDGTPDPENEADYLILGMGAKREFYGFEADPETLSGAALQDTMRRKVANWHPNVRKLVEMLDPEQISTRRIRTSQRMEAWPATRVTLLGDAIHSMTPYRGIGANIALQDASLLSVKLAETSSGETPLLAAVGEYEAAMRDYGFAAVESSRKAMEQAVAAKKGPGFAVTKTAMRVVNAVPALKRKMLART